ncbi:MAG: lipopolysaccharide biosynthesis protein [Bacteroidales bacterium]
MLNKIFNTFSIKFASAIFNLIIAIVVSRYLGANGKGEQIIILTTISFILIFVNIAGGATLVYLTSRYRISYLISISYIWSFFTAIIFYFILYYTNIVHSDFVGHICLLSLINSFSSINANILLGKEKVNASNLVSLIQPFVTLLSLLVFFVFINISNVNAYIYALYFAYSLSLILSFLLLRKYADHRSISNFSIKSTLVAMISFGFLNQLSHITALLNARLSYYLLEKYKGVEQLGIYSNGVSLTEAVWMVSGSMAMVQYARIANSSDENYAIKLTIDLTKISLLLSFLIIIPMVLLPSGFYSFVFGKEFVNINYIMLCLAPGILLWNISLLLGHYFSGNGKFYIEFAASSVSLLITLLLSFWAIPVWGFYGAAIISSISYFFNAVIVLYFFKKECKLGFKILVPDMTDIKSYILNLKSIVNQIKKSKS